MFFSKFLDIQLDKCYIIDSIALHNFSNSLVLLGKLVKLHSINVHITVNKKEHVYYFRFLSVISVYTKRSNVEVLLFNVFLESYTNLNIPLPVNILAQFRPDMAVIDLPAVLIFHVCLQLDAMLNCLLPFTKVEYKQAIYQRNIKLLLIIWV